SKMNRAAVVWKVDGKWQKQTWEQKSKSVQWLEAKAVEIALQKESQEHINICTDSMYVAKLLQAMRRGGCATSEIAVMLNDALNERTGTVSVIHVMSHQSGPGPIIEGNRKADQAAAGIWTLQKARLLHQQLHIGAKALAKECNIPITEARKVIATCPYCQR
ncbi:POL1 protein, partial [Nothocercus julius]|nr:POL1 protein [Nothocercus julius]